MKQTDLVRWYIEEQNTQGLFSNMGEVVEAIRKVRAVIQVKKNYCVK